MTIPLPPGDMYDRFYYQCRECEAPAQARRRGREYHVIVTHSRLCMFGNTLRVRFHGIKLDSDYHCPCCGGVPRPLEGHMRVLHSILCPQLAYLERRFPNLKKCANTAPHPGCKEVTL